MKSKKILSTLIMGMFIVAMIPMLGVDIGSASPTAKVYIVPSAGDTTTYFGPYNDPYKWNNTDFTIEVRVANVTNLYGWNLFVGYNTTLLRYNGMWVTGTNQCVHGSYGLDYLYYEKVPPVTSNDTVACIMGFWTAPTFNATGPDWGVLCWLNFTIIYAPTQQVGAGAVDVTVGCALDLCPHPGIPECTELLDDSSPAAKISHTQVNGYYSYTVEALVPGMPVADFHWTPTTVFVCTNVYLWDDSTPGDFAHLTAWLWTLTGNFTWLPGYDDTMQDTAFHCNGTGIVTVNLQVWNNWTNTNNITKYIEQRAVIGAFFDLTTSENRFCGQTTTNIGEGTDEPCDALSPDVNVTLYVEVTWNGAPVNHVLVAFEVLWLYYIDWASYEQEWIEVPEDEQCVLYRTAETNKDGIALIWFRVPTPCTGMMSGKWLAIAKAKVQEEELADTMPFDVGYLINIIDVFTDESAYPRCYSCLTVTIKAKSISQMAKNVTWVVVAYDDCDVPIGQYIYRGTVQGAEYCSPVHHDVVLVNCICIPQWAYVGIGKIYASAFTRLPRDCGVPYCPEGSNTFDITYVGPCP